MFMSFNTRQPVILPRPAMPAARTNRPLAATSAGSSVSSSIHVTSDTEAPLSDGITGNAMTVPPPKPITASTRPENTKLSGSPRKVPNLPKLEPINTDAKLKESNDKIIRELKEALLREKQKVTYLEQLVDSLRKELAEAQLTIDQLKKQEVVLNETVHKEKTNRLKAEQDLQQKSERLQALEVDTAEKLARYQQQLAELRKLNKQLEMELEKVNADKEREVSDRDAKLDRLKKQMAETMQGNAWQRQQQLDELNKELVKVQEEADVLRSTLRNASKVSVKTKCSNCERLAAKVSHLEIATTAGDKTINDLKDLIAAYEKRLSDGNASLHQTSAANINKANKSPSKSPSK